MLQNIIDMLKSTVAIEVTFNSLTPTLVTAISKFTDNWDSRTPIYTGASSIAALWGLDYLHYADDSVFIQLNNNYSSAYFRLHDLLVYDQIILDILCVDSYVREYDINAVDLAAVLLIIRKAIVDIILQLA